MKNQDLIDLCEGYEPLEYLHKELLQAWKRENEPVPEPFYGIELDGEKFFYIGNTRIRFRSISTIMAKQSPTCSKMS